ncbi:MAG: GDSL-type esterase/lipase family protein [Clostridium sp.]|nr:GDSL-type esterase/lipase family protein [Clostridium sp.]
MRKGLSIAVLIGLSVAVLLGAGSPETANRQRVAAAEAEVPGGVAAAVIKNTNAKESLLAAAEEMERQRAEAEVILPENTAADAEINAYLADSVIIGDSIVLGYRNYCMKSKNDVLKGIKFLAAGSFSAHNALWPVSSESVHPLYQGKQHPVWESVALMGAKNVFICFGLNDLNIDGDTCEYYKQVIDNILTASPEANIHIISMTYTLKDKGVGKLNNDNIRDYNLRLQEMAEENGWGYMDLATPLSDEEGNLKPEYCSDGFVHQTSKAYAIWTDVLHRYLGDFLAEKNREVRE